MKKVIFSLVLLSSIVTFGYSFASSDVPKCEGSPSDKVHINLYQEASTDASVINKIEANGTDSYSIFFCKKDNWCEVVNKANGETGWISLSELKTAEQEYINEHKDEMLLQQLVQITKDQENKITALEAQIAQQQQQLNVIIQRLH